MQEIKRWLDSNRAFDQGVKLYESHGNDSGLKAIFALGENSFSNRKLSSSLEKIYDDYVQKIDFEKEELLDKIEELEISVEESELLIQELESKQNEPKTIDPRLKLLYNERQMLHAQLKVLPSLSDRKRVAFKILTITDKVEAILDNKEQIDKPEELPTDRGAMAKMLTNNRCYISKNQNKEKKADEVERRKKQNIEIEKILDGSV